jgi:two-component system, NtrC family, sensor histidine kinase KinB
MRLKLKTKIALGGIFLFMLLLLTGIMSFYYFNRITDESKDIIKDNYETLNYSKDMLLALDEWEKGDTATIKLFEKNLHLQEDNITEAGEKEMTTALRKNFELFKNHQSTDSTEAAMRKNINSLMYVNLQAIDRKNKAAQVSSENAKAIITIILTACILLGITFIFNFPSLVANPIAKLSEGIKAIANKNYRQRIHLNRTDEFGDLAKAFNTMAEKLDEYEHSNLAKILFEKQRAETVINSLKDASIGLDNSGMILFANQQALHLLSLKETDMIGQQQETLQKKNDLFRFLVKEQSAIPFKIVLEGKENYFTKEIIDIHQQQAKIGTVIILRNITPFKELDTAKTNFIATISHELKTPLASSDFSLKLLEDERTGQLTPEQKELVQSLKHDNQRLLRIISELLDMTQVESGRIQLNIQPVPVTELIGKAEASVLNMAREKNITTKKEIANNLPAIRADAEKTVWVLNNFLTNAIRYSYENGDITIRAANSENNMIEIGVQDFGIGIEPSYQQKVFDRFFRVPGSQKKGNGLGLAISKEFIEAMGGQIGVVSHIGQGSYFYCLLPATT